MSYESRQASMTAARIGARRGLCCTMCHEQTDDNPDLSNLDANTIKLICEYWKCTDCLDELDEQAGHD